MIQVFLNENKHNGNMMKDSSIKSEENKIDAAEVEDKKYYCSGFQTTGSTG